MSQFPADAASIIAREYVQLVDYYEKLTRLLCKLPEWRKRVQILDPRASKVCEVYHSCAEIRTLIKQCEQERQTYNNANLERLKMLSPELPCFIGEKKFEVIKQMDEILLQIELFDKEHYFRDDEALMLDRMNGQLLPAVHRKMIPQTNYDQCDLHTQYTDLVQRLHRILPDCPQEMLTDIAQKAVHNPKLAEEEFKKLKSQYQ